MSTSRRLAAYAAACAVALLLAWSPVLAQTGPPPGAMRGDASGATASGIITGTIVDGDTGEALPSASVAVWRLPRPGGAETDTTLATGTITNNDGSFRIEGIRPGLYRVVVSFVGYTSETIEDVRLVPQGEMTAALGTVRLGADVAALEAVEVEAERTTVQMQIDRTVYSTADSPVTTGGSATDVLETIPSVEVDIDGNISLRGSQNVAVLINGRPAPVSGEFLASYLRSLPAGTIESIEVIPNPSARYEPEGMGGILNIVLKEEADRGIGGTLTSGVDTRGGYNANAMLSYGKGKLNLTGSYGLRRFVRGGDGTSFRINRYLTPTTFLDQTAIDDRAGLSHFANLSADYNLSSQTVLSSSVQFGLRGDTEEELNTYLERGAASDPTLEYERIVEGEGDGWNGDVRLGLRHAFSGNARGSGGHLLTAEARLNASAGEGTETFTQRLSGSDALDGDAGLMELQNTATEDDRQEASVQVDYVRPMGDARIEAGYKGDFETRTSDFFSETWADGAFRPDAGRNNVFDFEQNIQAAYLQAGAQLGRLGLQAGVRAEIARTVYTLDNLPDIVLEGFTLSTNYENDYRSLFPSAFATYELNETNSVKASYSRRINRPRMWNSNPFPSYDDPLNVRIGNPGIKPEYVNAFELGYVRYTGWGSLTFTPYYRLTTDVVRSIQRLEGPVTIRTFENLDTSESYGLELIGSFEGKGWLDGFRGYASLEGFREVTDGSSLQAELTSDAFGWGGRGNASYTLRNPSGLGPLSVQANLRYRAPMDTEQGRRGAMTFVDVALRQQLFDERASLALQFRDPFGLAGFSYAFDQPRLYQEFERSWGGQQVGLTFTYNFGEVDRRQQRRRGDDMQGGGDFEGMEM